MKNLIILALCLIFVSCKQNPKTQNETAVSQTTATVAKTYPENLSKVFKAHGTLELWNSMNTLKFSIPKEAGNEVTTTHLKSRKSLIEMPKHAIGFDGTNVWLKNKDTAQYKGNAKFYYNLMFYFYAMPFVLADQGIRYNDVPPLVFEGNTYPGIKISYSAEVGESPDDEYVLYYNPETFNMEWLSYTVTYFSKTKSKTFKFIKYSNWQNVEGLRLPKTLTWYNTQDNMPTTPRNDLNFINVALSTQKPPANIFKIVEGARIVE